MKKYQIELKWALIFVAMMLLWMLLERMVGLHDIHIDQHPIYTNLVAIPAILIYGLALREKRDRFYGGKMTWKQGFFSGVIISLIVTVFSPLSQYITSTFITPDFFSNAIEYSVKNEKATQAEAEAYFNLKSYILQGLIGAPIMGIVTTALVALFVRKK